MGTTEHDVVIAGGGPTGLVLAAELALAGTDVAVVERRTGHEPVGSRAKGFNARTIELLDQRGVAGRFLAEAHTHAVVPFGTARLDLGDLPSRHPYVVGIPQERVERLLGAWAADLSVPVLRGIEVTDFAQDATGVDVRLSDGRMLRAGWLVGCDGGRSLVRKEAGIAFPGRDATRSTLIAEGVAMAEEPPVGLRHDAAGVHGIVPAGDGTFSVVVTERAVGPGTEPTPEDLRSALAAAFGTDFGAGGPAWISRFTDATRQAAASRAGRVLIAGDAAHVHYPVGGQGLGLGVQDAVNLGWKLAAVAAGHAPEGLLDTYDAERRPAVARVLRHTMAMGTMQRRDGHMDALVETVSELAALPDARRLLTGLASGLDVRYDLGEGHPLLGRRMPDLDLETADGPVRAFALLHDARPVLLHLGVPGRLGVAGWSDRVRLVDARHDGAWELPVLGAVAAPDAVLIRPDGHVAWVGDGPAAGLEDALARWFGPPAGE
ncbi:FAD-dependent monooxygenase [Patulibacter sp. NPDC049589]|uniref:FAD-dependent monooxygenase n=1 Tax=Patulibacter sp. NPDC049589 TaxID=3154731 RepID=UPI00341EEEDB